MATDAIHDPDDPRLAEYANLKDPELRRSRGLFVAEGRFVVRRLVEGGRFRIRSLVMTASALDAMGDVVARLDHETPVFVASTATIRRLVGYDFHRGCLAAAERGTDPGDEALLTLPGPRLVLALEHLTDPDNVGAVFRNAMAFGVDAVLLSTRCADPLYRKTIRTSAGATLAVPFGRVPDWATGLARMRTAGYRLIALTPERSATDISALDGGDAGLARAVLILGSEGAGLTPETRAGVDLAVRIPMAHGTDSLNVATASGIALHRLHGPRSPPPD